MEKLDVYGWLCLGDLRCPLLVTTAYDCTIFYSKLPILVKNIFLKTLIFGKNTKTKIKVFGINAILKIAVFGRTVYKWAKGRENEAFNRKRDS